VTFAFPVTTPSSFVGAVMMSRKNYDQKRTKKQPPVSKTDEGNLEAALIPC
jgi:hypothetical protein